MTNLRLSKCRKTAVFHRPAKSHSAKVPLAVTVFGTVIVTVIVIVTVADRVMLERVWLMMSGMMNWKSLWMMTR